MSLCMILSTPCGIVVSADRRIVTTTSDGESFVLTDHEKKIFISNDHVYTHCGTSSTDDLPVAPHLDFYLKRTQAKGVPFRYEFESLKSYLRDDLKATPSILMGGAFDQGQRSIANSNLSSSTNWSRPDENTFFFSGASVIAKKIIDIYLCDRNKFPLQESIDYLRFINYAVAKTQHFTQVPQTVSEACDIAVITEDGARFIAPRTLV